MVKPAADYDDEMYSVIEDLDPDDGHGGGLRFDLLLGIPLILAVILFAGWQWWHNDYQASQYRAGQDAVGRNDWEGAVHYFAEASGYSDADAQASGAREKVEERERLYKDIVANTTEENWMPVLRDIRQIARIQPDYKDMAQREQAALARIYDTGLNGTVALRLNARPVGLYYRADSSWIYLEGSDRYSALRVSPGTGRIIYDAPDEGWQPAEPDFDGTSINDLRGRHLVKAEYADRGFISYKELTLNPSQYVGFMVSENGIWGMDFINDETGYYSPSTAVVRNFSANAEFAYEPFNNDTISYAPPPNIASEHAVVVEVDQYTNRYLMADWNESGPNGPTENTIVNLYLMVAGSNTTRIVFSHKGGIISAQFGPTGRYVLVHTFDAHKPDEDEKQSIVLIDLDSARTVTRGDPVARATVLRDAVVSPTNEVTQEVWLGAAFVPSGFFMGNIVLSEYKYRNTSLQMIDPTAASNGKDGILVDTNAGASLLKRWVLGYNSPTTLRLLGNDVTSSDLITGTLDSVTISVDGSIDAQKYLVHGRSFPRASRSSAYGFAWSSFEYVQNAMPDEANNYFTVYSVLGAQPAGSIISPTLAYKQALQQEQLSNSGIVYSIVLGERFFAYSFEDKLHIRSYDGKDDLIIEAGVQSISEQIDSSAFWTYFR